VKKLIEVIEWLVKLEFKIHCWRRARQFQIRKLREDDLIRRYDALMAQRRKEMKAFYDKFVERFPLDSEQEKVRDSADYYK
jgi:DNA-binding Lrp family transcriptional regulator